MKVASIPLNTWLMHRRSQNIFKVIKIHTLHVTVVDERGEKGYANRYILESDLNHNRYVIDKG